MKEWIKRISLVLIGFSVTLGIMYVNSRGSKSNEINSKQMAVFIEEDGEYKVSKTIPTSGYEFNEQRSFCNNGAKPTWNSLTNGLKISNLTKDKTSCMLYFDLTESGKVLAELGLESNGEVTDFSKTSCKEGCDVSENGVYEAEDDFGTSYYYRGTVENNWVKFGNMSTDGADIYWRIVRINGDGSIRLIYSGNDSAAKTGMDTQISTQSFNSSSKNNMYFGYEWKDKEMHGYGEGTEKSNALTELENWFKDNLKDEWNDGNGNIDINAGFCNDRSGSAISDGVTYWSEDMQDSGGTEDIPTNYGAYLRLANDTKKPILKCSTNSHKNEDYFTAKNSTGIKQHGKEITINGTKSLTYPIGLITADELAFAGGVNGRNNKSYWLHTGENYWTMTPYIFNNNYAAYMLIMQNYGAIFYNTPNYEYGLRPVINLKSSTTFTGSGTTDDPYIIK